MKKKTIVLLLICFLAAAVVFCLLPLPSKHTATLNAVKLDASGNEVGQVEIPLEYVMVGPIFDKKLSRVSIGAFDGIGATDDQTITKKLFDDYYSVTFGVAGIDGPSLDELKAQDVPSLDEFTSYSYRYIIEASEDTDRWCIRIALEGTEYYYVGSLSGNSSTAELMDFFK